MKAKKRKAKAKGGNCYHAALGYLMRENLTHSERVITLVHGIVTRPDGLEMGHAWVEFQDGTEMAVYEPAQDELCIRELYYAMAGVVYTHRYTLDEVCKLVRDTGHGGPWDAQVDAAAHA